MLPTRAAREERRAYMAEQEVEMRRLVQMLLAVVLLAATALEARAQGGADQLPTSTTCAT